MCSTNPWEAIFPSTFSVPQSATRGNRKGQRVRRCMIWLHDHPPPPPPPLASCLSFSVFFPVSRRSSLLKGEWRRGRARSQISINPSIQSGEGENTAPPQLVFFPAVCYAFFMHLENLLVDPLLLLLVPPSHLLQLQPIVQLCEILVDKRGSEIQLEFNNETIYLPEWWHCKFVPGLVSNIKIHSGHT